MRECIGHGRPCRVLTHRIDREQQQRPRIRRGVPDPNRVGRRGVANEHGVDGVAEEFLHQRGRALIGADEIGQGPQHRAVTEALPGAEERGCRGREPDAIAFQLLQRIHAALQCGQCLLGADERSARHGFALTGLTVRHASRLELRSRRARGGRRGVGRRTRLVVLPARQRQDVVQHCALTGQRTTPLTHFVELARGTLAIVFDASRAILEAA